MQTAIDKAVKNQYGDIAPTAFQARYQKEVKTSEKEKLTALFDKRMTEAGFIVLDRDAILNVSRPHPAQFIIRREVKFSTRGWKFDRAIESRKLAIEIEGGVWRKGGGAHSHPSNIMRDIEKYNAATLLGWRILRFTDYHLKSPYVVECVQAALQGGRP